MLNQLSTLPAEAGQVFKRKCDSIDSKVADEFGVSLSESFKLTKHSEQSDNNVNCNSEFLIDNSFSKSNSRCSSVDNDILSASDQNLENKIKPK
jgi:hypothetical protein